MLQSFYAVVLLSSLAATPLFAQRPLERLRDRLAPPPTETIYSASVVLAELSRIPARGIPAVLMADAQGVVVIPRVLKAGFVIAGSGGHGLVMTRNKLGQWGSPVFVNFGGGSVGLQVGVESTDVVLVFRDGKSLDRLLEGKGKLTLGGDVSIAAGPLGRRAQAGTDLKLEAEVYSYSRSRGLFAGVALQGSVLRPDESSNEEFRADKRIEVARQVEALRTILDVMSSPNPPVQPVAPALQPPAFVPEKP